MKRNGFTLIELLIVLTAIVILSVIVVGSYDAALEKRDVTRATSDLVNLRKAVETMAVDTRRWPNGCTIGFAINATTDSGSDNEIALRDRMAGLGMQSNCGSTYNKLCIPSYDTNPTATGCAWPPSALGSDSGYPGWKGPYAKGTGLDPWGHPYWFDNDYRVGYNCPTSPYRKEALGGTANEYNDVGLTVALVSLGPDGNDQSPNAVSNLTSSDCDDIYVELPNDHGSH